MAKSTSVFLDGLRLAAALIVFGAHANYMLGLNYHLWLPSHLAVMVFFVLSGCVIAYTTFQRHPGDVQKYIIARLSRLYSVVIPALILTGILFFMGGFD